MTIGKVDQKGSHDAHKVRRYLYDRIGTVECSWIGSLPVLRHDSNFVSKSVFRFPVHSVDYRLSKFSHRLCAEVTVPFHYSFNRLIFQLLDAHSVLWYVCVLVREEIYVMVGRAAMPASSRYEPQGEKPRSNMVQSFQLIKSQD